MYIPRQLDLPSLTKQKSCFLFGPRQTGKSSLIAEELKEAQVIDLLDDDVFLTLQKSARNLESYIQHPKKLVIIDEIQRVPALLNEVHRLIESKKIRFLLTGSSARKLRRHGTNLLGGRAKSRHLHGLVSAELGTRFDLKTALLYGTLPSIYFSKDRWDDLKSYVSDYLKEEIAMEAATRNLSSFSRFLETAAISNGALINYDKIASLSQVKRSTVQNYFQILRDTLIGRDLPAFTKTRDIQSIKTSKFYLFDNGVVNYLKGQRDIYENSAEFGFALEAYLHHELSSYCDYRPGAHTLQFWRSVNGFEVDFLIDGRIAIEVKSTKHHHNDDLKGLHALKRAAPIKRSYLICREQHPRIIEGISLLPVDRFLHDLWAGKIVPT
jgi:uncharacterized protein